MKKIMTYILLAVVVVAFAIVALGPERMNPVLETLFGVETPEPVPPIPVPRAEGVADRVMGEIHEDDVAALVERFASYGSRVPGYAGHEKAADFIVSEFQRLGMTDVETESFGVTAPIDKGGVLKRVDTGETFPIYSVWPNLVKTSTVPQNKGHLVYGGDGAFASFDGHEMEGAIVLMEFNSWNNWINAGMLGAKQVIFIEPDSTLTAEAEQKFLQVPNSVERFWIEKEAGRKLQAELANKGSLDVTIEAEMVWEKHEVPNVLGWIPGLILSSRKRQWC